MAYNLIRLCNLLKPAMGEFTHVQEGDDRRSEQLRRLALPLKNSGYGYGDYLLQLLQEGFSDHVCQRCVLVGFVHGFLTLSDHAKSDPALAEAVVAGDVFG